MKKVITIDLGKLPKLTEAQNSAFQALAGRAADTVDLPEAPAENWQCARRFCIPANGA